MSLRRGTSKQKRLLRATARLWGVQPSYSSASGETIWASDDLLAQTLGQLCEHQVRNWDDVENAYRQAYRQRLETLVEPVLVFWNGRVQFLRVNVPADASPDQSMQFRFTLEDGKTFERSLSLKDSAFVRTSRGNSSRIRYYFRPKWELPLGYHKLSVHLESSQKQSSFIISAPQPTPDKNLPGNLEDKERTWGFFVPLYALRDEHDWGVGDYGTLKSFVLWTKKVGGSFVGLLPLLAEDLKDGHHSPYTPLTKLFWNEVFLDVTEVATFEQSESALKQISRSDFQDKLKSVRETKLVDYATVHQIKNQILSLMSREFFESDLSKRSDFKIFLKLRPELKNYARFCGGADQDSQNYHLFVQYHINRQLGEIRRLAEVGKGAGLYLDYPLGMQRGGFDAREFPRSSIQAFSVGAPPDPLFHGGQNWGFAPLHPAKIRETRYTYFRKTLREHFRFSSLLRIDHVMGLQRLYCIPEGNSAKDGLYIRYFEQENYAIVALEASRAHAAVIGEDLGTVPASVRDDMQRVGMHRLWVYQLEFLNQPRQALKHLPAKSMAAINTHDMPPFHAFWANTDLSLYHQLGIMDEKHMAEEKKVRLKQKKSWSTFLNIPSNDPHYVYEHLTNEMAKSPAKFLLLNIEDLWGELEPQNVPGTWKEFPNWQNKLARSLEEIVSDAQMTNALSAISVHRNKPISPATRNKR